MLLKTLVRNKSLNAKQGPEQEQILDRIAKASNGSFVWAILVSELLADTTSLENFTKTLEDFEKSKISVTDLVQRLVLRQDLPATTRTVVGWMTSAERPLTTREIHSLLHEDKTGTEADVDLSSTMQKLEELLFFSDNIIRFKHKSIHHTVSGLVETGKVATPSENKNADIIIKALSYAKSVLKDDHDPTFDEYELETVERTFREHPLLAYTVRYWAVHLRRLGSSKYPKELGNILSNKTIFPLVERAVWGHDLPLLSTLELHKIALQVRQSYLKQPSPAVLQTTIDMALLYDLIGRPADAGPLYYSATKISHNLLFEQLTIDLSERFLRTTEEFVETKRTDTMTRREEIYKVLITLFERQYGATSGQVIQTRTMLARFYEHIHEVQAAAAIYEAIEKAETQVHGRDSTQARGVSDHLNVTLGRSRSQEKIETRKESIFDEDDDDEAEEVLDVTKVTQLLQAAKTERAFVELWQRISTACQSSHSIELHEKNFDVATAYSRFLVNQKRSEEASAVLSSLAREYERSSVALSDRIVSRLSQTASFLQELKQHTAALSILRSTSQIYQSLQREETHQSREIQRQVSCT